MQTNLPIDKKHRNELLHQKREECLVYDVRFETGEICKELLWVSNRLGKESVKKKSIYFEGSFGLAFVNMFVNLIIVLSTKEALRLDKMVERYIWERERRVL